jgi:hypothetical protein
MCSAAKDAIDDEQYGDENKGPSDESTSGSHVVLPSGRDRRYESAHATVRESLLGLFGLPRANEVVDPENQKRKRQKVGDDMRHERSSSFR